MSIQGRARNQNAMTQVPMPNVPTSINDLSHDHKTSFNMGLLVPFLAIPTLPGGFYSLAQTVMLRYPRLYLPIMHRIETHVAYFHVSNDILWDHWKEFIKPKTSGNEITCPFFTYTMSTVSGLETDFWKDTILAYMGFPTPMAEPTHATQIKFNALPIAAYYKVWNDFYRRPQIQVPFGETDAAEQHILQGKSGVSFNATFESYWTTFETDNDYTQNGAGYADAVAFYKPLYRNWSPDMFTQATFEPAYNDDVIIPLFDNRLTYEDFGGTSTENIKGFNRHRRISDDALTEGDLSNTADVTYGVTTKVTGGHEMYMDVASQAGTLRQLAYAESMQKFLERINRYGDRYRDIIRGLFGTDPSPFNDDYTVYIGSKTGVATITEVLHTADTTQDTENPSTGAGAYSGQMVGLQSTGTFKYRANEHGWIIGIINVQPRSSYMQAVEKFWEWETWEDLAFPQFANVGDEPLTNRNVSLSYQHAWTAAENTDTWGYVPRYTQWRFINDRVSGEVRTEWSAFHLSRIFAQGEVDPLSGDFLMCYPDESRVFEITGGSDPDHSVYAWIWNQIVAILPIPKYGMPAL